MAINIKHRYRFKINLTSFQQSSLMNNNIAERKNQKGKKIRAVPSKEMGKEKKGILKKS